MIETIEFAYFIICTHLIPSSNCHVACCEYRYLAMNPIELCFAMTNSHPLPLSTQKEKDRSQKTFENKCTTADHPRIPGNTRVTSLLVHQVQYFELGLHRASSERISAEEVSEE